MRGDRPLCGCAGCVAHACRVIVDGGGEMVYSGGVYWRQGYWACSIVIFGVCDG
jgi:hypothetical protein